MREEYKSLVMTILFCGILGAFAVTAFGQMPREITILTEPNTIVWVNDVRFGTTDASGKLTIRLFSGGTKKLRVRAEGFKETTQNLLPAQKGNIKIALVKTTDQAELAFQQAESLTSSDREKAIELYKKAISLRPRYPEAYLGLARILTDSGNTDEALKAIKEAKKLRPAWAEASAVEGRIHKENGDEDLAISAFKKSITEGKGFQAEALTGLGLLYREKAEGFGTAGDFESQREYYLLAAAELKKAAAQLSGSPDGITIYQLLGDCYERMKMYKEAIAVYEEFLKIYPDTNEAVTVRSFITQLKKQMNGEQ